MSTRVIRTLLKAIWSAKSTTTANFVAVTGPMNTALVENVKLVCNIDSATDNGTYQIGYNTSDDGISWSSTVTGIGSFATNTGWTYDDGAAATISADLRNFVRFGFNVKNTTGAEVEQAMGQFVIKIADTSGQTVTGGPEKVWSRGLTSATVSPFHPLTAGMPLAGIGEIRASLEMQSDSGDAQIQPAYQVSNDNITWNNGESGASGSYTAFGTELTAEGLSYGTTFTAFDPTQEMQWVRFGVMCRNGTAGKNETCSAKIRVDVRS